MELMEYKSSAIYVISKCMIDVIFTQKALTSILHITKPQYGIMIYFPDIYVYKFHQ